MSNSTVGYRISPVVNVHAVIDEEACVAEFKHYLSSLDGIANTPEVRQLMSRQIAEIAWRHTRIDVTFV